MVDPGHMHFTTLEQLLLSGSSVKRLLMACAMGGAVGLEREWRHKDSGLRTNILICMGSALFTIMSIVIAGDGSPNRGQIASNIVQGIGFLGAGLILHTKNRVLGLTSAATVWVVAAIGMTCGAGLYLVAALATLLVLIALQIIGVFETHLGWKRYPMIYEVRADIGAMLPQSSRGRRPRRSPRRGSLRRQPPHAACDPQSARLRRPAPHRAGPRQHRRHRARLLHRHHHPQNPRPPLPRAAGRRRHRPGRRVQRHRGRMSRIPFVKAHACGNDFLIIEESLAQGRHAALARKLCSRNTGIGADGIEFLDRQAPNGQLFLRLFNADGSEAELSGNGTRCVAAWLAASEGLHEVALGTHGGVRTCRLIRRDGVDYWIESNMGVPRVMPRTIEIPGVDGPIPGAMVNMGNPHFVLFPESEDFSTHGLSWQELGAKIAVDPLFPHGTNVEFVRILSPDRNCLPHLRARLRPHHLERHRNLRRVNCRHGSCTTPPASSPPSPKEEPSKSSGPPTPARCSSPAPPRSSAPARSTLPELVPRAPLRDPASSREAASPSSPQPPRPSQSLSSKAAPRSKPTATTPSSCPTPSTAARSTTPAPPPTASPTSTPPSPTPPSTASSAPAAAGAPPNSSPSSTPRSSAPTPKSSPATATTPRSTSTSGTSAISPPSTPPWPQPTGPTPTASTTAPGALLSTPTAPGPSTPPTASALLQPGRAEGRLLGGCLSILAESLGTPYALHLTEPTILFLEDINTKPYQWDRMLNHLRLAGQLDHVRGIVFGDPTANIQPRELPLLEAACLHALHDFTGPIAIGLQSGHMHSHNRSIPLGTWVTMDADSEC